ncbi:MULTISPECIES: response regulator transcription factor [Microvirgula]|uniref:response regulator transcription factor n=1 Tax=Microvirgula TaxID=57479 RepID=UPI000DC4E36E|nr:MULTISPECIES: response regulator transcription factor [Microvirgula]RAS15018.1 LuxR family two component transcriptional regulator [Microvirgula sp. AG722]
MKPGDAIRGGDINESKETMTAESPNLLISVILIDDHPVMRYALRHMIEEQGRFNVLGEAEDASRGFELIRTHFPDVVLLDLFLPDINGLDLIYKISVLPRPPRILVLSGQDERLYSNRVMSAGAHGYVSKSKGIQEIKNALVMVAGGYSCFPIASLYVGPEQKADRDLLSCLTKREMTVLIGLVRGQSNKEIADSLFLSQKTISSYKVRILEKLHLHTLADMINFAIKNKLIESERWQR